ncbi:MAG TPA: hypothetical protein VK978_04035 [Candidatus Saccharimonadales bacterium]|nr:hypothetical protein [Candidatus Saccharimonadales bacterium]
MGNTKNIIDINGKRYDAVSGTLLGDAAHKPLAAPRSVDGFRPNSSPAAPQHTAHKSRTAAAHLAPHKPVKAATLMRSAVKKPDLRSNRIVAQAPAALPATLADKAIAPKLSHASIDPKRQKRASRTLQSPAVSKYGNISTVDTVSAAQVSLAAYKLGGNAQLPAAAKPVTPANSATPTITVRPVGSIGHVTKQPDIFEQALKHATSHEQPHTRPSRSSKKRSRFMATATVAMVFMLALGVFAYFNAPKLSVQLASSRAGFEARLPHYSPAGFSFGNLSYSHGNVVLNYQAEGSDARNFNIIQRVSDWDSQGLLSNFVASSANAYQTYERAGRTVYVYGNNSATWVDSGIWYVIEGSDSLTKNQLLDMASSL